MNGLIPLVEFLDRISQNPGRVELTDPNTGEIRIFDLKRADNPTEPGTPINRALFNWVASVYGVPANVVAYILTPNILTPAERAEIESNDDLMAIFRNRRIDNAGRGGDLIINGNFDIWQRGVSQTINGYHSADRWNFFLSSADTGAIRTLSRVSRSDIDIDLPDDVRFFSRISITSILNTSSCTIVQRIEDIIRLSGETVTVSFWAKADSDKQIGVAFIQRFGTGGSPPSASPIITINITDRWEKYDITMDIHSVRGKIIGDNSNTELNFIFSGEPMSGQTGTFDIAQVKLERGDAATPFIPRHIAEEEFLCKRFFEILLQGGGGSNGVIFARDNATVLRGYIPYKVSKRTNHPTVINTLNNVTFLNRDGIGGNIGQWSNISGRLSLQPQRNMTIVILNINGLIGATTPVIHSFMESTAAIGMLAVDSEL